MSPSIAALETQPLRKPTDPQCEVKRCQSIVSWILESKDGIKHLACWDHAALLALKYSGESDCLMVLP